MKNKFLILFTLLLVIAIAMINCQNPSARPFGGFITMNGINDYIEIPNNQSFHMDTDATVEALIKFPERVIKDGVRQDHFAVFINCIHPDNWGVFLGYGEYKNEAEIVGNFSVVVNDEQYNVFSNTILKSDVWYHITGVREAEQIKIFINGQLDNVLSIPTDTLRYGNGTNRIGRTQDKSKSFLIGSIDELRIWNYARKVEEIKDAWNTEIMVGSEGLIAYYKFNESGQGKGINVSNSSVILKEVANGATVGTRTTPIFENAK